MAKFTDTGKIRIHDPRTETPRCIPLVFFVNLVSFGDVSTLPGNHRKQYGSTEILPKLDSNCSVLETICELRGTMSPERKTSIYVSFPQHLCISHAEFAWVMVYLFVLRLLLAGVPMNLEFQKGDLIPVNSSKGRINQTKGNHSPGTLKVAS